MSGTSEGAPIETPRGTFALRPERPEDADVLFRLFHEAAAPRLRLGGFPDALVEQLIEMQFRAQRQSYRAQFPDAAFMLVVWNGEAIGRLVIDDTGEEMHIVDIVLRRDRQGQGLAAALLAALQRDWARRGRRARATVAIDNRPSRRLWLKLGFAERPRDAMTLEVFWPA